MKPIYDKSLCKTACYASKPTCIHNYDNSTKCWFKTEHGKHNYNFNLSFWWGNLWKPSQYPEVCSFVVSFPPIRNLQSLWSVWCPNRNFQRSITAIYNMCWQRVYTKKLFEYASSIKINISYLHERWHYTWKFRLEFDKIWYFVRISGAKKH